MKKLTNTQTSLIFFSTFFVTLLLLLAFSVQSLFGQCNMVVNPDFSAGSTANSLNLLTNATNWYNGCPTPCNGYSCGTIGNTPDLMDANTSNPSANGTTSFPNGPHYPYVGTRWAYLGSIESFFGNLTNSLESGILYKIRLRVSTSDVVSNTNFNVTLRNGSGSSITCSPLKNILSVSGTYSTSGWDLEGDTFSLTTTEAGQNLNKIHFEGVTPPAQGVHIDSIGIEAYKLIAGTDTAICLGSPYQIGPPTGSTLDTNLYHWVSIPTDATLAGQEHSANPIVAPTTPTQYILSFYDSLNPCGVLSDTITLFDAGCCVPVTGSLVYTDDVLSSTGTVVISTDAAVNGLLTLTGGGTFVFDGSDVSFGTDAQVLVESGTGLEIINGSYLHACDNMWDGIYVENGAEIIVNGRSLIEDAEDGLYIEDGANYMLSKANFNKNYRHVTIASPASGTPVFPANLIDSCLFLCQTTASIGLTPVYTNLAPPRTADSTLHGVWAYDVRRLQLGVKDSENYFSNCRFGASTWIVDTVDIQANTFEDVTYTAISASASGSNGDDLYIYNNTINRTPTGIYCYHNPFAITKVYSNTINFAGMVSPPAQMTGIIAIEISPGDATDPNHISIKQNIISNAPCGIYASNLFGTIDLFSYTGTVYIGNNEITHTKVPNDNQAGILAQNVTTALLIDNDITHPSGNVNWWETGIRQSQGNTNWLICNNTHDVGRGIFIDGTVTPLQLLANNTMQHNQIGLFLNWGVIGAQGSNNNPWDNKWPEWPTPLSTWWSGSNPNSHVEGTDGDDSPFFVQAGDPFYPDFNNFFGFGPITVNTVSSGSWTLGCMMSAPSYKTDGEAPTDAEVLMELLNQQQEEAQTDRERSQQWMGQYGMYKKLLANEELRQSTPELTDFYQSKESGNMGRLHHAVADFNRLRNAQADGASIATLQQHQEAVESITPENRAEQTLSEVMRILYANTESLSSMNTAHETQLRQIAQRCPLDDGFGVYMARAALLKLDTIPRNYLSECELVPPPQEEETRWKDEGIQNNESNGFSVYPNPNNGHMMVGYSLNDGESGNLSVYTVIGELVLKRTLNEKSNLMEIDLFNISSGIYLLDLQINGEHKFTERLNILKE